MFKIESKFYFETLRLSLFVQLVVTIKLGGPTSSRCVGVALKLLPQVASVFLFDQDSYGSI